MMNKKSNQILCRTLVGVLALGTSFALQAKRKPDKRSHKEHAEKKHHGKPSPEMKKALKECSGGKKRKDMTEADHEKARACMEAKGLPPPPPPHERKDDLENEMSDGAPPELNDGPGDSD